jgi:predicted DsbA family dithiol-disulfide isomerase
VPSYGRRDTGYSAGMNNPSSTVAEVADPLAVEVVSDLICPWCYIGKRRLERAGRLLEPKRLHVHWKPFQLNPDMPAEGMDRREYRTRKFGSWAHSQALDAEVVAAGKEVGIAFDYVKMTRTPNTLAGHKLLWLADEQNCQGVLAEKLFRAYFVEGRDVGDVLILTDIGVEVGLMPKDIAEALSGEVAAAAVALEEEHARRTWCSDLHGAGQTARLGRAAGGFAGRSARNRLSPKPRGRLARTKVATSTYEQLPKKTRRDWSSGVTCGSHRRQRNETKSSYCWRSVGRIDGSYRTISRRLRCGDSRAFAARAR